MMLFYDRQNLNSLRILVKNLFYRRVVCNLLTCKHLLSEKTFITAIIIIMEEFSSDICVIKLYTVDMSICFACVIIEELFARKLWRVYMEKKHLEKIRFCYPWFQKEYVKDFLLALLQHKKISQEFYDDYADDIICVNIHYNLNKWENEWFESSPHLRFE